MAIQGLKQLTVGDAKEGDIVVVEAKVVRIEKSGKYSTGPTRTYVQFAGISDVAFFDNNIPVKEIKYDFKVNNIVDSLTTPGKRGKILFILQGEEKALVEWDGVNLATSQKHTVVQLKNIRPSTRSQYGAL
ncbi:hypothetical protein [Caulobacter phage Cr30]|uniref:hypothetical protein n=1 Tax=Caulobacter phage Cr30 TaxID=1357714 RepID=UPI0004A9B70C|nr:hypothetical protein OZ74_gp115 [Caulobacter phage Cr30]AGS81000.1 hypothetical protein [Caulobacter phage Cr30]